MSVYQDMEIPNSDNIDGLANKNYELVKSFNGNLFLTKYSTKNNNRLLLTSEGLNFYGENAIKLLNYSTELYLKSISEILTLDNIGAFDIGFDLVKDNSFSLFGDIRGIDHLGIIRDEKYNFLSNGIKVNTLGFFRKICYKIDNVLYECFPNGHIARIGNENHKNDYGFMFVKINQHRENSNPDIPERMISLIYSIDENQIEILDESEVYKDRVHKKSDSNKLFKESSTSHNRMIEFIKEKQKEKKLEELIA